MLLDDWQKEVLAYNGDICLCTGRRVGKTQIMAIKACEYMLKNPNHQIIIASLTEDQAKLIIQFMLIYLQQNYKKEIGSGAKKPTQSKIILKNGSVAIARPVGNTGDAIRGFSGNVLILDEVSRFNELILEASTPILLTTGGQIWMCSTPYGKQGFFWKMFDEAHNQQDPEARFKVFYKSSQEVIKNRPISESWTEKLREKAIKHLEKESKSMSKLQYGQEYEGLFLEDLRQFFPDELINRACTEKRPSYDNKITLLNDTFAGVDIARLGEDEIAYSIIDRLSENRFRQIELIVKKHQLTTTTRDDILSLCKIFNCQRVGIDAGSGSLGVGVWDMLMETEIKSKIKAMNNRKIIIDKRENTKQRIFKEDMYENLKAMMEQGEVKLLDDEKIKLSLKSIQIEYEKDGLEIRVKIYGKYSHIVESLIRACWLAKKEKIKNFFIGYM